VHVGVMLVVLVEEESKKCRTEGKEVYPELGESMLEESKKRKHHWRHQASCIQQIDRTDNQYLHFLHIPSQDGGYRPQITSLLRIVTMVAYQGPGRQSMYLC
jgi:hypothetical protein